MRDEDDPTSLEFDRDDRALIDQLRALPPEGEEPDWQKLTAAIRAEVGHAAPQPWWRSWRWLLPIGALAATAALAFVLLETGPHVETVMHAPSDAGLPTPAPTTESTDETTAMWLDGQAVDVDDTLAPALDELDAQARRALRPDETDVTGGILPGVEPRLGRRARRHRSRERRAVADEEEIVMKTLLVLIAVLVASPVVAQPAPKAAPAPVAQQEIRREKIKKRIRALRAYTLTEELALDEQTAGKLFPILSKFDDEFDKLLVARAEVQRRLESSGSVTDPKQLDKLIDDAVANQRAMWETEEKRLVQLRKILTPAQTARVLVVLPAMERKIQNQLRRAVRKAGRAQRADDDDDDEGDELGGNPPAKAPRPVRPGTCDPFSDVHGCGKK